MEKQISDDNNFLNHNLVDIILSFQNSEQLNEFPPKDYNFQSSLDKIEEMENHILMKVVEEQAAKLSRIQSEKESLNALNDLDNHNISNAVKINVEEFIRLINDSAQNLDEKKSSDSIKKVINENKSDGNKHTQKIVNFIEKNIQLAKCGKGVFSLTAEENKRIENLLSEDIAVDFKGRMAEPSPTNSESELMRIDEQLAIFRASTTINDFCLSSQLELLNSSKKDDIKCVEENKSYAGLSGKYGIDWNTLKNERQNNTLKMRLKEIDKILAVINSKTNKEIDPLTKEEIQCLIRFSQRNSQRPEKITTNVYYNKNDTSIQENNIHSLSGEFSSKTLTQLVSDAKQLMPNFKFRYSDS